MKSFTPRPVAVIVLPVIVLPLFVLFNFVPPAIAQPGLSSLWPVDVGREWEYDIVVQGPFDEIYTGVRTQTVVSQTELTPGVTVACFDVASTLVLGQTKIITPSLLAVSDCSHGIGFRVDDGAAMGSWSDSRGDWDWWWMTANPTPGSTFRLQIRTQLVDDSFVDGVVRTIDGVVTTAAGSFTNAVIVDYVVELGETQIIDMAAGVIGTASFEVVGWVAFVPDVGPVASEEAFFPAQIDCSACGPAIFETITTTMDLRALVTVPNEGQSFGRLKARF